MQIQKVDPRRESFSDYLLEEHVLTIGEIVLDLDEEERDQEVVISFTQCEGVIHRGLMSCGDYVAEVIIPPRRYVQEEVPDEAGEDPDEDMGTHTENVPVPLDIDSVILKLWPVVDSLDGAEIDEQEGVEDAE
ncbi:hypothetical protein AGMMS49944_09020 [Spirochaetia bacterium]|nr:hypothetical protein AGMMS49944_09020 [Spirochaetia bacterium]